jgi:electron transport complex protein RnfG
MTAARRDREGTILGIALNLMAAGLISGLVLAVVNHFTQPIRERNEEMLRVRAMQEVLPAASRFEPIDGFTEGSEWFRGLDAEGRPVGYAVPVDTRGYEGRIAMILGVDNSLAIVDFRLIKHRETPGLGARATEEKFRERFRDRKAGQLEVTKRPEPGKILAITGATITSRAIAVAFDKRLRELASLAANGFRQIPTELFEEGGHR